MKGRSDNYIEKTKKRDKFSGGVGQLPGRKGNERRSLQYGANWCGALTLLLSRDNLASS